MQQRLDALRRVLGQEAVEDALRFYPTQEIEAEAERDERERAQAERTAEVLTMRDTRDLVLAGKYGVDAKAKLSAEVVRCADANAPEVLRMAAELAAKERKAEYFRRLNASKKDVK